MEYRIERTGEIEKTVSFILPSLLLKSTRGAWLPVCFFVLHCACAGPAHAQAVVGGRAFLQKPVSVQMENASLALLVKRLADATGRSILVEGHPLDRKISLTTTDTVEKVITDIATQFDYEWTLSRSGVILLHKRFFLREDRPEFNVPEIQAGIDDLLNAIRAIYPEADGAIDMHDQVGVLGRSLSPGQRQALTQGQRFRIGELSPDQQRAATLVIYAELLYDFYGRWQILHEALQNPSQISLCTETLLAGQPPYRLATDHRDTYLAIPTKNGSERRVILNREDGPPAPLPEENEKKEAEKPSQRPDEANVLSRQLPLAEDAISLGECTLKQVAQVLQARTPSKITVSPVLLARRMIVEARHASMDQILSALAELHEWALTKTEAGNYILLRHNYLPPQNIMDIGPRIKAGFPADFRRFLTLDPVPKEGERFLTFPLPAYKSMYTARRVATKLEDMLKSEIEQFYRQTHLQVERLEEKPLPYSKLSAAQQQQCLRILVLTACQQTIHTMGQLLDKLTTYQTDPANAWLFFELQNAEKGFRSDNDSSSHEAGSTGRCLCSSVFDADLEFHPPFFPGSGTVDTK